jgi:type IV pilus assembly protein PilF
MQRSASVFIISLSIILASCVSETTGGFNQADPEERLNGYLELALGYVELQDFSQARRHLINASEIDPNNSDIYGIWGLVYTLEGDLNLADESFLRDLRLDSGNSQVRNNYAAFLFSNNRFQAAYDKLEEVVEDTEYAGRSQAF